MTPVIDVIGLCVCLLLRVFLLCLWAVFLRCVIRPCFTGFLLLTSIVLPVVVLILRVLCLIRQLIFRVILHRRLRFFRLI